MFIIKSIQPNSISVLRTAACFLCTLPPRKHPPENSLSACARTSRAGKLSLALYGVCVFGSYTYILRYISGWYAHFLPEIEYI